MTRPINYDALAIALYNLGNGDTLEIAKTRIEKHGGVYFIHRGNMRTADNDHWRAAETVCAIES